MATNTKNYNLVKPAENELADISVLNKNMDTIDEQMLPVNGLNSVDLKKPLAAAQGKVLNEKIGDLSTLTTEHKENLVQAINEAADGAGITVVTESEYKDMQKAGTVDADKLYGIVDAFDSSARNVAISDILSAKLGIIADKNVEKAIDTIDTKVDQNAKAITEVSSTFLKQDGSVQMTGVLKTVGGGTDTIPELQIQLGDNAIYNTDGQNNVSIVANAYFDGTVWRRKNDGTASIFVVYQKENVPWYYYAVAGAKDSAIAWIGGKKILTDETGFPLTGGTMSGGIIINTIGANPSLTIKMTDNNAAATLYKNKDTSVDLGTVIVDNDSSNNFAKLRVRANETLNSFLTAEYRGSGAYNIYGTHNITVSTSAPASAIAEGAQHQVYA
nr:hypothetical protein [uncultured Aminipila sp.]